jgi:hypothetical protein
VSSKFAASQEKLSFKKLVSEQNEVLFLMLKRAVHLMTTLYV